MKQFIILAVLGLASCNPPMPTNSVQAPQPIVETDTITTIVLSDAISRDVTFSIEDNTFLFSDKISKFSGKKREGGPITITAVVDDTITYLKVNGTLLIGRERVENIQESVPFEMIDYYTIRIHEGATLQLISRYYDVPMSDLKRMNNICGADDRIFNHQTIKIREKRYQSCDCN